MKKWSSRGAIRWHFWAACLLSILLHFLGFSLLKSDALFLPLNVSSGESYRRLDEAGTILSIDLVFGNAEGISVSSAGKVFEALDDHGKRISSQQRQFLKNEQSDSLYYNISNLTKHPIIIDDVSIDTPELDRIASVGQLEIILKIRADGTVASVVTTDESYGNREFLQVVISRFMAARFFPGQINGVPVASQLRIGVVTEALRSED